MDRALSLARQGYYVFPVGRSKRPFTTHGHLDATTDPETIAVWWTVDYPDALLAVHTGRSGLVVLDLDRHHEDADGFVSMELGWLGIPDSWSYTTTTNDGQHIWLRAPAGLNLPPQTHYHNMPGVDRKSGSSYVVVYATQIPDTLHIADAPDWLLDSKPDRGTGDTFEGGLDAYLAALADGEPTDKVLAAIERIPEEFDHNEMVARQMELIRLGAEGKVGVKVALDILREAWTRPPWNDEDHRWEFDDALNSGITKFGAQSARIAELPLYRNVIDKLGSASLDRLVGAAKPKSHYFDTIRHLAAQVTLTEHDIASLIWHAPATSAVARDWGIDYLYSNIGTAKTKALAPVENPALDLDGGDSKPVNLPLLSEQERAAVEEGATFVDSYLDWAATKVNVLNEPYHRQNALTVLSMGYGMRVFARKEVGPLGCNLFQIGLGESSTGKNESIALRDPIIEKIYDRDPSYDLGSNPSPEALHETLLRRNLQCSLFNTDEAAAPFNEWLNKSYQAGVMDRLTSYYEGRVTPMLRRGNNTGTNQRATVSFNIAVFGTPDRVISLLNRDQFKSGFLARFLWCVSDTIEVGDEQYRESEVEELIAEVDDPAVSAYANTIGRRSDVGSTGIPVLTDPVALDRLSANRKAMTEGFKGHEQWDIIEPSIKRLGDNVRKIAILMAVSDGADRVQERHALHALSFAEEYLRNLEIVANKVSASIFERNCQEVLDFIVSQGGGCPITRVYHKFRGWDLKDTMTAVDGLERQGRIRLYEETAQRGARVELNSGE